MGKIEPEVSGFKSLFGGGGRRSLDEMEETKGRDTALQKKLTKKGPSKVRVLKY